MRIMRRFPSDVSLASSTASSAASGCSLGRSMSGGQSSKFGGTIPAAVSSTAVAMPPPSHPPAGTLSVSGNSYHHMDVS